MPRRVIVIVSYSFARRPREKRWRRKRQLPAVFPRSFVTLRTKALLLGIRCMIPIEGATRSRAENVPLRHAPLRTNFFFFFRSSSLYIYIYYAVYIIR